MDLPHRALALGHLVAEVHAVARHSVRIRRPQARAIATRDQSVAAAIDCFSHFGFDGATTRMIAEKAGANIASINYYFRTKEILVNQALEITIKHMLEDVNETINNLDLEFREILKDVIYYMISGASVNMGITSAHLYRLVIDKNYDSRFHTYTTILGRNDLECRPCQSDRGWLKCNDWKCQHIEPEDIVKEVINIL